ncbi:MAG: hypothetical protein L0G41_02580 [Psychrobacter sp.]|nr:hypothetical protein [Psychrobacter sp.]
MSEKTYALDDAGVAQMCDAISFEILVRTIRRLAPDLKKEIEKSGQEFLDNQDAASGHALLETVGLIANELTTKITSDHAKAQKESTHE